MAAVEGSLEEEALKRRDRLKAMRKKSGLPDEQVSEVYYVCFYFVLYIKDILVIRNSNVNEVLLKAPYDPLSFMTFTP